MDLNRGTSASVQHVELDARPRHSGFRAEPPAAHPARHTFSEIISGVSVRKTVLATALALILVDVPSMAAGIMPMAVGVKERRQGRAGQATVAQHPGPSRAHTGKELGVDQRRLLVPQLGRHVARQAKVGVL